MTQRTLLIVDDEPAILEALSEILEAEGFGTLRARNGKEALEKLEPVRPDIILLDLMMPVMDGCEFAQRFRKLRIRPRIPIVVLSAGSNLGARARDIGACGHLGKPFELDDLLQLIRLTLEIRDGWMWRTLGISLPPTFPKRWRSAVETLRRALGMSSVRSAQEEPPPPLPADMPSPQERPAPPLRRDVYPYVMGGLLHDALNVAASLQHFSHKEPDAPASESKSAARMRVGLERLVRVLRLMQDISRAYYVPEQQAQEQETIERIADQYRHAHPEFSYAVSQSKPLDLPVGISTFLVGELLENATRACEGVSSPRIELRINIETDGTASIICTDNGRGFPEELLERIRSGHLPRPDGVTLRGHGLYLMKEIVERLKGRLLCANLEEGGARVQILLPREERAR